jgi:hypothetical protein
MVNNKTQGIYPHEHNKALLRVVSEIMLQTVGKDRLSIENTNIHTDGINRGSAASGKKFATFKVKTEHSKISEI